MPLSTGTRVGPYEIQSAIGAGGMGEVYQARDTRLDRNVAVKILPGEFSQNAQLKMRFEREARTISQLEHPNICRLYDVGDSYLVMELLDGESLADKVSRGPLPIGEVLRYGIEIAEALHKAHEHGVIHRDLKPANVMITRSGAKLLDFGLARSAVIAVAADGETIQRSLTQEGTIVGTFQYMAPEQLESANVDHRTDIFAFGAVLYEMATGRRAFQASTRTSLIAAIVAGQPAPVSQIQPLAPPALEHVIQRCLAKDPAERWQSARDVAEELKWIREKGSQAGVAAPVIARRRARETVAWVIAAIALLAAGALATWIATRPQPRIVTSVNAPDKTRFSFDNSVAVLSPDGNSIAFVASAANSPAAIWVRRLESPVAQRLPGTDNAMFPFWSPDGRSIAFFADGYLKRTDAGGGPVERVAKADTGRGGSWGSENVIVFAPATGETLFAVRATGGDARPITQIGTAMSHRFPSFFPDGVHFLFYVQGSSGEAPNVLVGSTDGADPRPLLRSDGAAIWSDTGHVLWVRDGVLRARRFDPKSLQFEGDPVTLAENVHTNTNFGVANFSAAAGRLTYVAGEFAGTSRLALLDRTGKELEAWTGLGDYFDPRFSPDGRFLAYAAPAGAGRLNIFVHDVGRRVTSRFTFGSVNEWSPVWSPDGKWIAYTTFEHGPGDISVRSAGGTGAERKLISQPPRRKIVSDWTRDDVLLYHTMNPRTGWDISAYSMRSGKSEPVLVTPHSEVGGRVSPNGRWLAYAATESGAYEVYVRSFGPNAEPGKWQVSPSGGQAPSWSPDGSEIYFVAPDQKLMVARVGDNAGSFTVDTPQVLIPARVRSFAGLSRAQYTTRDGKQFVLNVVADEQGTPLSVTVVQNWQR